MRAGAIRGPRYSGRERTKSGILNVSRIEQVQNASIARAGRPQHARAALEPLERRLPPRGGHWAWGATAQSAGASGPDEPVITGERTPGPAAAAAAGDAALAAGRADRERAPSCGSSRCSKFSSPCRAMRPRLQLQRARRSSARCGTSSGPRRWRRRPRSRSSDNRTWI